MILVRNLKLTKPALEQKVLLMHLHLLTEEPSWVKVFKLGFKVLVIRGKNPSDIDNDDVVIGYQEVVEEAVYGYGASLLDQQLEISCEYLIEHGITDQTFKIDMLNKKTNETQQHMLDITVDSCSIVIQGSVSSKGVFKVINTNVAKRSDVRDTILRALFPLARDVLTNKFFGIDNNGKITMY